MKYETSFVVNRPIDEVFAFTINQENQPKWQSRVLEMKKTSDGPIGVGTTWRGVGKFLGRRIEVSTVVTEYELNRTYAGRSTSGPFPIEARQSYEPVDGGTRVTFTIAAEPGGFFKVAEPVLLNLYKRQAEAELATLKEFMERASTARSDGVAPRKVAASSRYHHSSVTLALRRPQTSTGTMLPVR